MYWLGVALVCFGAGLAVSSFSFGVFWSLQGYWWAVRMNAALVAVGALAAGCGGLLLRGG